MKIKNCIIIHGCPDDSSDTSYNKHWIPWIVKKLTAGGGADGNAFDAGAVVSGLRKF